MAIPESLPALVARMPDPDRRGMFTENIDKDTIDRAVAEIYAGGRDNIQGLIEMLADPGTDADVKPHYALHCVLNRALVQADEPVRREFCAVLAGNLSGPLPADRKAYLCQELQWAGRDEACPALGELLLDETLVEPAAMALTAIGGERAAAPLRAALPRASGKCRLNVIHALAALADPHAAGAFKEALADPDREVRIAAGAGLARLGDPTAGDALLDAAKSHSGWERIQDFKHCLILAEQLAAAGRKPEAAQIYQRLRDVAVAAEEQYLRKAADKGLAGLEA